MLTAVLLGFVLGIRHAADPDHVAAIAALVARHRRASVAARIGAAWGIGHSLTIVLVGGVLVAMRIVVSPSLSIGAELLVAVILITLGIANLRSLRSGASAAVHHAATHCLGSTGLRAFAIGIAHGLGGTAAVGLLALAATPTPAAAVVYLAVFGAGTVGGMVALSFGLGIPLAAASDTPSFSRWVLGGSGALSICAGIYLALSTGAFTASL
jgi:high-affinity nickel-transport protein